MEFVLVLIIIALAIFIGILLYQLDLTKHYYAYDSNRANKIEQQYITEKEQTDKDLKELRKIAYTNATTKIWNIDYFIEKSLELFTKKPHSHYTLVAFNILNIGRINQLFGPTEGDQAIYFTAQTLRHVTSKEQIYAQIYSNLFCILFQDQDDSIVLSSIHRLSKTLQNHKDNVDIYPAFGIYHVEDTTMNIMDMINYATLAQKFVTENDTYNYKFFTQELNENFQENKRMSAEMEQALQDHKFFMYLQPMVDLHSHKIICAEALVRWDYPGKGILSPYAFLPLFENSSLIQKLDYYMWEEGCKTIRRWIDNKIEPTPISLNISPTLLATGRFVDYLVELMEQYLIDRNLIILEIPEKALSNMTEPLSNTLFRLHEEGFTLCIDNFGSLNSPLNVLKDFPIDRIKLDRTFLAKNVGSEEGLAILRYLIAMAKELNFTVIVEGMETEQQVKLLSEIGCDIGQGYYFSKPVDLRNFDQMNKIMIKTLYRPNEYYPTFEDFERDIDLLINMLKRQKNAWS